MDKKGRKEIIISDKKLWYERWISLLKYEVETVDLKVSINHEQSDSSVSTIYCSW